MLTIDTLQEINEQRAKRWHSTSEWSGLEWAGAMCGEAGEAANVAKKLKRIEDGLAGNEASDHRIIEFNELKAQLANEIGGTLLYLSLLASRYDINLAEAVIHEFNRKSIDLGFPERLCYIERD